MVTANNRKKITVIHMLLDTYVRRDIDILKTKYEVTEICVPSIKKIRSFLSVIGHVANSHLIFGWFADYPVLWATLIGKLFRRKSIVIIVGYEVGRIPEIGYGRLLRPDGRKFVTWTLRCADQVLAVSDFSRSEAINKLPIGPENIRTLYHGFEIPRIKKNADLPKEPLVLTVAYVRWRALQKKGLETFVRSAAYLRDVPFVLLGDWWDSSVDYLKSIATNNVQFIEVKGAGRRLINDYYKKAKVYVQASMHESFGCAPAEAMLWECVPVATKCGSLPEVIGNTGYYTAPNDPKELASNIALALQSDLGHEARERIIEMFPLEKRKAALLKLVEETITR